MEATRQPPHRNYIAAATRGTRNYKPYELVKFAHDAQGVAYCNKTLVLLDESYNHYLQHIAHKPWKGRLKQLNARIGKAYDIYLGKCQRAMGAEAFDAAMDMMDVMQAELAQHLFIHKQSLIRTLGKSYEGDTRDTIAHLLYCDHTAYMGDAHGAIVVKCKSDEDIMNICKALKTMSVEIMGKSNYEVGQRERDEIGLSVQVLANKVCGFEYIN